MAASAMSAAVRAQIVSRIRAVLLKDYKDDAITQKRLDSFEEYTSGKQIRSDTDTVIGRHESIMSRGAFETLLGQMRDAINAGTLSNSLSKAASTISFDGFVAYISEKYYKDKEFLLSNNRRVKNGFIYTGPSRRSTENIAVLTIAENRDESFKDVLLLKNIPQGDLVKYYSDYIVQNTPGITEQESKDLKNSLQGGHLTGVFTARLIRAFSLQKDTSGSIKFRGSSDSQLTQLENQLASIVELITDADFLSSNISKDIELFTETDKRLYSNAAEVRLTTEVQFKSTNEAAGDLLKVAGRYLSNLIRSIKPNVSQKGQESAAQEAFEKLLLNLTKVSEFVKLEAQKLDNLNKTQNSDPKLQQKIQRILNNQKAFETLISTSGSKSVLQHLEEVMVLALQGKKITASRSVVKQKDSVLLAKKQTSKPAVKKPVSISKKLTTKKVVLKKAPIQIPAPVTPINLVSILNARLHDQIRKNMGIGDRRDILNYRTGRFAESVEVTRTSTSRQGMITAFYTYMKNPYATFSQGGRQEFPRTRDPKALISKSIRQIASDLVTNQLRAVNV